MTLPQPTHDMGKLRPEEQCKPRLGQKMIDGIIEFTEIISEGLHATGQQKELVKARIQKLKGEYKGLTMFEPFNDPRQKILQAALSHLMGIPETQSMKALRLNIHIATGSKSEARKILQYLRDQGITRQDLIKLRGIKRTTRNLIQNGGSLSLLTKNKAPVPVPH